MTFLDNNLKIVINRGKVGNPYRDSEGRFDEGTGIKPTVDSRKMVPKGTNKKRILETKLKSSISETKKFEKELLNIGFSKVDIQLKDDIILGKGISKSILESINDIPNNFMKMINLKDSNISLNILESPSTGKFSKKYKGFFSRKNNSITMFYDMKNQDRITAQTMSRTIVHELAHLADRNVGLTTNKKSDIFKMYAKVSRMPYSERSNYITDVTHGVENVKEFYANTITSYLTRNTLYSRKNSTFITNVVPILDNILNGNKK